MSKAGKPNPVRNWQTLNKKGGEKQLGAWSRALTKGGEVIVPKNWNISTGGSIKPLSELALSHTPKKETKLGVKKSNISKNKTTSPSPMAEKKVSYESVNLKGSARLEPRPPTPKPYDPDMVRTAYSLPRESEMATIFYAPEVDSYRKWEMEVREADSPILMLLSLLMLCFQLGPEPDKSCIDLVEESTIGSGAMKISGNWDGTVYISTPFTGLMGMRHPFVTFLIKNMDNYFSFEVDVCLLPLHSCIS
jgi:hypothetical protein